MSSTNGYRPRRNARLSDVRRFNDYRDVGLSPVNAAMAVGFGKSWGYQQETERRKLKKAQEPTHPMPAEDMSDAVALVIAERKGEDTDDHEEAFAIVDRLGAAVVPDLCRLVWFLATERVQEYNRSLKSILEGTPMAEEHAADPVTFEDVLHAIPVNLRGDSALVNSQPAKVRRWMDQAAELDPELRAMFAEVDEVMASDDPESGLVALRKRIRAGT